MSKLSRYIAAKKSIVHKGIALCAALTLAVSPMNAVAFAETGASSQAGRVDVSEPLDAESLFERSDSPKMPDKFGTTLSHSVVDEGIDAAMSLSGASAGAERLAGVVATATAKAATENLKVSLKWPEAPEDQKQDLTWSDDANLGNPTQIITYRLAISSSNVGYDEGKLVVRIPRSLWTDRFGVAINPTDIAIPQAPEISESAIPFNYSIDATTNELVITNTASVPAASNYEIDVQYTAIPWNTIDDSKATFVAKATGTATNGATNSAQSNAITYIIDTDVRSDKVIKTDGKPLYFWDSFYTGGKPQPANFSDYRWVSWRVVMGGAANQPYSVTLRDVPGQGGEVYAVSDGDLYYHDLEGSDFTLNADGTITSKIFYDNTVRGPASAPIPENGEGNCIRVLVRYPKTGGNNLVNVVQETLRGVDSLASHTSSSNAFLKWEDYEFSYEGAPINMIKFAEPYNEVQSKTVDSMLALLQRGQDVSLTWGMRTTEHIYAGANYGGLSYHGEMVDDATYWTPLTNASTPAQAKTLMTKDDFQYQSAKIYVSNYHIDRSNGQKVYFGQNAPNAPKITIWGMTDEASGFQEVGSFLASELSYEGASANLYKEFTFPAGTYRAKVTFGETYDYLNLRMDPTVQLKASSPTLLGWLNEAETTGSTLSALRVQNFNYQQLYSEGNIPLTQNWTGDYRFDSAYVDNAFLAAQDTAKYGKLLDRSSAGITVTNLTGSSETLKYASPPDNDSAEQAVHIDYWLHGRDWYNMTTADYAALTAAGWPAPARDEALFYDLLPRGMVYDGRQYPVAYDILGNSNTSNINVQHIDNYRGTGRQMVIFSITAKTPGTNVTSSTEIWTPQVGADGNVVLQVLGYQPPSQAGYTVKFRATLPWNKILLANTDTNLSAYQVPETDQLRAGGHIDNGIAPIVQEVRSSDGSPVFSDLRGNGINENVLDTKYMTLPTSIHVPIALGSGLVKQVRTDASLEPYTKDTQTTPHGGYTYRMTADTDSISRMKNLVLFDIIEEAQNINGITGETSWRGIFDSVDASDANLLGINPLVYYSTSAHLSYATLDIGSLNDLTIWSTNQPADSSTVTAIAVDMRYRADGSAYVFEPSSGVSILMHMKAPSILPVQQYAFNRAAYHSTLLDPHGLETTETNVGERTTVAIADTPVFTKAADPLGGTTANDASTVQPDQEITYTLSFDPKRVNAHNIVMKDSVPAGLTMVPNSITFTPAGASVSQPIADTAFDAATNELTWPTYNQAVTGLAKFQFKATVQKLQEGTAYRLYQNKATATMDGEKPRDSNIITHQQLNRWAEVSKAAALVEGVDAFAVDAAQGGTVQSESNGALDAPVITRLGQLVEYHLVAKNMGAKQLSGELDITDMVPAGTTYISHSATIAFRSTEHPESPVIGSLAYGVVQEPTVDAAQVHWKLNQLADGEEAYLTFRVAAPITVPGLATVDAWPEKRFENIAQMVDVKEKETKETNKTYHCVQEAKLTVTKQWQDTNDIESLRPANILMQLSADGIASGEPVVLDAGNGWSFAWTGLAGQNPTTGQHISYTVTETKAVAGYEPPVYTSNPGDISQVTVMNKRVLGTPVFEKFSNPTGGWNAESATIVQPGQELTYTLTFDPMRENAKNIVVSDKVPAGLDIVPGSITFTPADQSTPLPIGDQAYQAETRDLVWPAYNQAHKGAATLQFKVTAHPLDKGSDYLLYENRASVTLGTEPPRESNVITHQQFNRWADVEKTAALVQGIAPSDPDAAYGGVMLEENSGTEASPVKTDLNQMVEYHMVVKNAGQRQTSGELKVTDIIPAGTTYISGSATMVFRSTTHPEGPLPASVASGIMQEPTVGNSQVQWILNQLSHDEEAYLTFRVSAPAAAFVEGQADTGAQKSFENTAQMFDVAKNETKATEVTHHRVEEARVSVQKQWDDANNREGFRPWSVSAQLYADGFAFGEPVPLNVDNGWFHAWTSLALTRAQTDERVVYSVQEVRTVGGYEAPLYTVTPENPSLTTITNKRVPGAPAFVKTSDPAGGSSSADAASVQPGQEITYSLSFDPARINAKNIVVKDFVPAGLELVSGSITFTPSYPDISQPIDDTAFNIQTRELTWPAYDQGLMGNAKFQFKVRVSAFEAGTTYRLYENKATAAIGEEQPFESNVVVHQQLKRWASVEKTAALVEGAHPTDSNAAQGGTVQSEQRGTQMVPVDTNLAQIVEYHLVVKNTGEKQKSGQINVNDAIPANTAYIPGSATVLFRSTAQPESPLTGSTAQAVVQEPTTNTAQMQWILNQMSDGEEAYLTFRVGAPGTAFDQDQKGMWAEKSFENTAQMIDVITGETKTTETTYHKVQEARITAQKQWDDADNGDSLRPQSILVQLYADGIALGEPVILSEGNHWAHGWNALAALNAKTNQHAVYTVKETQTVAGYEAPVYFADPQDASLVTVVNRHVPETPTSLTPTVPTPPTLKTSTTPTSSTGYTPSGKELVVTGDPISSTMLGLMGGWLLLLATTAGFALRRRRRS